MIRFAPFFRLELAHDYFGAALPPIALQPDRTTERLAARPDLRLRAGAGIVEAFASTDRRALAMIAAEEAGLTFTFRLRAHHPGLLAVTATLAETRGRIPVIDAGPEAQGALQAGAVVGEADLRPLAADDLVTEADLARPPLAILRLRVAPEAEVLRLSLRFGAVERFWTYHVLGGAQDARLGIRDRAEAISFDALGERVMANGASARSFRSSAPIAARARPESRFELVSEGPFGPRVVLPALPCPTPGPGRIEEAGGARRAVSDIYVNLL